MLPLHVDPTWYESTWLTDRAPSRAARIIQRARVVARGMARATSVVEALIALRLQRANADAPSFR
jgi:hypothetical protein